jgi:gluconokinase
MKFSEACGTRPVILIVAGVSGSGKTTVGATLAGRLGWPFADADSFHPPENIEKMHAGIPLTDTDRWPWLRAIAAWMDERLAAGESAVITCSALRRSYRDLLLGGRPRAWVVFLAVDRADLARRLATRAGHFFPAQLLDSQLSEVELPGPDEQAIVLPETSGPAETVGSILGWLDRKLAAEAHDEAEAGPA